MLSNDGLLSKDGWACVATRCEWPEVWVLMRVCKTSYEGCKSVIRLFICALDIRLWEVNCYTRRNTWVPNIIQHAHWIVSSSYYPDDPDKSCGANLKQRAISVNNLKKLGDDFFRFAVLKRAI